MKLKYYYLTKEEKRKLKEEYYNTEVGSNVKIRLIRVLFYGIIGIIYSIYLFFSEEYLTFKILASGLFILSLIFIVGSFKVKIDKLNAYLVKKNKK